MSFLARLLAAANTHAVGGAGLGTTIAAIGIHIAAHAIDPTGHGNGLAQKIVSTIDNDASAPASVVGVLAAYFGRPKTIPVESP